MLKRLCLAALLAPLGCGPATPEIDHTSVQGSALGATFSEPNAVYALDSDGNVELLISDAPQVCDHIANVGFGRSQVVEANRVQPSIFVIASNQSSPQTVENGVTADFEPGGEQVNADGRCTSADGGDGCVDPIPADQAQVQIFQADKLTDTGAHATGSFDLQLQSGGHFSGEFRAAPCLAVHESSVAFSCASASGVSLLPLVALLGLRRHRFTSREG